MMAIADAETHHILGAAILGTSGDEEIHGILDAMNARIPYTVLQRAVLQTTWRQRNSACVGFGVRMRYKGM